MDGAKVSITSGEGALRGLTVGNPAGFNTKQAFSLGEIMVALDVGTVTQNPVVIKEIVIAAPEITYEVGTKGSNIDVIKRNVSAYGGGSKGKAKTTTTSEPSDKESRKLVIQNLYLRKGKVNVSSTLLQGQKVSAGLPDIHLKDIGKAKGGATPEEITKTLVTLITQSSIKAVGTIDPNQLAGSAKDALLGIQGQIPGTQGAAEGAAKSVEEGTKNLGGALKKMFGR
ncbi:MAG: hypothetical protein GTO40_19930 [Deltaproteobacteria bacterium]|nr:hypothetical protein [Deltaproteobacteria bacterium]